MLTRDCHATAFRRNIRILVLSATLCLTGACLVFDEKGKSRASMAEFEAAETCLKNSKKSGKPDTRCCYRQLDQANLELPWRTLITLKHFRKECA
jgi:hypothetical protein